jgi:hypothetical protein
MSRLTDCFDQIDGFLNVLGYVLGAVIIGVIVSLGLKYISNDSQLIVAMTGIFVLLLIMAISCMYMRFQRATWRERNNNFGRCYFERIPKKEQTLFQLSIVLTIAMIALGIVIKWPLITSVVKELFGFNG